MKTHKKQLAVENKLFGSEHVQRAALAVALTGLRFPCGDDDRFGEEAGEAVAVCREALGVSDSDAKNCDTIQDAIHSLSSQMTAALQKGGLLNKPLFAA